MQSLAQTTGAGVEKERRVQLSCWGCEGGGEKRLKSEESTRVECVTESSGNSGAG